MHRFMDKATADYQEFEQRCSNQVEVNRAEQRQLEARLRLLKLEEEKLVNQIKSGKGLQVTSDHARKEAAKQMAEWKGKIEELCRRTETSLQVMEEMKSEFERQALIYRIDVCICVSMSTQMNEQ